MLAGEELYLIIMVYLDREPLCITYQKTIQLRADMSFVMIVLVTGSPLPITIRPKALNSSLVMYNTEKNEIQQADEYLRKLGCSN